MRFKSRSEFKTQWEWLHYLQNDLGCNDLAIQLSKRLENGDIIFFKRMNVLELNHYDPFDKIPINNKETYKVTRQRILEEATHRTILDIEVVLDIDEPIENCKTIKESAIVICHKLKDNNQFYRVYWTGSKSYHIHIFDEEFRLSRRGIQLALSFFGADILKSSTKSLIALEGAPHYKSGIPKQEVKLI